MGLYGHPIEILMKISQNMDSQWTGALGGCSALGDRLPFPCPMMEIFCEPHYMSLLYITLRKVAVGAFISCLRNIIYTLNGSVDFLQKLIHVTGSTTSDQRY